MSLRLVMAAIAVVAVPVALYAQAPAPIAPVASAKSERRVCESTIDIGSRLARARRCYSKAEHDAMKAESRATVDRVQSLKAFNNIDTIPGRPGLSTVTVPRDRPPF